MSNTTDPTAPASPETFAQSLERTLSRLKGRSSQLLQSRAVASAMTLTSLLGLAGCGEGATDPATDPADPDASLNTGKADWAQAQGQRNPAMVTYGQSFWHEFTNPSGRFGYQGVDVIVKLRVKPVSGADLSKKRVGVEWHNPGVPSRTAVGAYFATLADGYEEWHVRMALRSYDSHAVVFNTWYQDGKGNTFFDDNSGEFYAVAYDGAYSVVRQDWGQTKLTLDATGVHGSIVLAIADLDFDKDLRVRYTTDDWKTTKELTIGAASNALTFVRKLGLGIEEWRVDVNLPGAAARLQYAVVYRHGVINGARPIEFWDNNGGQNYVVQAKP